MRPTTYQKATSYVAPCPKCGWRNYIAYKTCERCQTSIMDVERATQYLSHPDSYVRGSAIEFLSAHGDEQTIAPLIKLAHDSKRRIPTGYSPTEDLGWDTPVEFEAIVAIAKRIGDVAVDVLIQYLPAEWAIGLLANIGNPRAIDALRTIVEDPAILKNIQPKHFWATTALGHIGGPMALSILEKVVSQDPSSISQDGYGISGKDFIAQAREAIKAIKEREGNNI